MASAVEIGTTLRQMSYVRQNGHQRTSALHMMPMAVTLTADLVVPRGRIRTALRPVYMMQHLICKLHQRNKDISSVVGAQAVIVRELVPPINTGLFGLCQAKKHPLPSGMFFLST